MRDRYWLVLEIPAPVFLEEWCFPCDPGVSHLWILGLMRPRMAMNVTQHKIINLLKTFALLIGFC